MSISAVQWLCNADKTGADPRARLKARAPRRRRPDVGSAAQPAPSLTARLPCLLSPHPQAFFTTLYRCLSRGARAVLQLYPNGPEQARPLPSPCPATLARLASASAGPADPLSSRSHPSAWAPQQHRRR